jgi:hypothetical protein
LNPAFKLEFRRETAAQILGASHTELRRNLTAVGEAEQLSAVASRRILRFAEIQHASVYQAVKRDATLCMSADYKHQPR